MAAVKVPSLKGSVRASARQRSTRSRASRAKSGAGSMPTAQSTCRLFQKDELTVAAPKLYKIIPGSGLEHLPDGALAHARSKKRHGDTLVVESSLELGLVRNVERSMRGFVLRHHVNKPAHDKIIHAPAIQDIAGRFVLQLVQGVA